jgi:hypothetical protein
MPEMEDENGMEVLNEIEAAQLAREDQQTKSALAFSNAISRGESFPLTVRTYGWDDTGIRNGDLISKVPFIVKEHGVEEEHRYNTLTELASVWERG